MRDPRALTRSVQDQLARFAYSNPLYSVALGRKGPRDLLMVPPDPWPGDAERGAALIAGQYRLGGQTYEAAAAAPWEPFGAAPEFIEALHGFEWLRDLRAAGGDQARRQARRLIDHWIERYDRWHPLTWRPDILGQRIASWLGAHDFFCASADDDFRARVFASLSRQLRHLTRVADGDPMDPRQIQTVRGLVYGAVALPQGRPRLDLAQRILGKCLPRQILPDGGHIQRNPAIHLTVLRHLIDIRAAFRAAQAHVPDALHLAIDRMAPALRLYRHGDGGFALFNDAQEGEPVLIDAVLAQADSKGRAPKSARHSGFERAMAGRTLLLLDVGAPPPAGVDDGAHAGLLSFELSVGRERMIVNCGAWPGRGSAEDSAWHTALRSTPAHSTLCVAGRDSAEILRDAGIGKRPRTIEVDRQETPHSVLIDAWHDGYREALGLVHRRRLELSASGDELRGEDILFAETDAARGLPFAIRFHLHPALQLSPVQGGSSVIIRLPSGDGWRLRGYGGEVALEEGIYLGRGTERRKTTQVVIWGEVGTESTGVQWILRRERRLA
ncbi:heparinase II/III family protein [Inquilinus limosus]|uniref:heparinase II/III family protein n=1 Tax=Inquilinus limosus TaxID=171674 RepID=UPI0003FF6BF3|nr:heparinase II/III family protein [Inquilinus limosus]